MIFGLYQNFELSCFRLFFSFCKICLVGNLTITNYAVANNAVATNLAFGFLGFAADPVLSVVLNIEKSGIAIQLKP